MTPDWAWATHQPMIQALLEIYKVDYILEIGVGNYSTPLFLQNGKEYKGIEQDPIWIERIKSKFVDADIQLHEVDFEVSEKYSNLTDKQIYDVCSYYSNLKQDIEGKQGIKLLFVDCFAASRMYAINILWKLFDIVIFHDSHPRVRKIYGYDRLKPNYKLYQLESKESWTSVFVKNDVGAITLRNTLVKYIGMFDERWGVNSKMNLT